MDPETDPSLFKRKRVTVNVPSVLVEKMYQRKDKERYRSDSDYFIGLLVFDVLCGREHKLTSPLMRQPRHIQDKVFVQLAKDFPDDPKDFEAWLKRKNEEGWFEKHFAQLVEKAKEEEKKAGK